MKSDFSPISPFRFLGICALFLVLANWLPDSVFAPLSRATASLSGDCLALFGKKAMVTGDMVSLDNFRVRIVTECTAFYSVLLFGTFLLSVPASLKARLAGLAAGAALLGSVNILRIAAVVAVGSVSPALFEIVHVYLGQIVMMLTVVAAALVWIRWSAAAADPFPFLLRAGVLASVLFLPWLTVNRIYVALLDKVVASIFSIIHPEHILNITRPLLIYNHTFEAPLYLSLIFACRSIRMRRKVIGAVAGLLVIAGWHALFRVTHVFWTAYGVEGIQPFHILVYLLGQYLLPFFLWLLVIAWPLRIPEGFIKRMARFTPLLVLFLVVAWPSLARAGVQVMIEPGGRNSFYIRAAGMKGITGGDIRINYETDSQTLPTVEPAELVRREQIQAATDSPGVIDIHLNLGSPQSGSGHLASIELRGRVTSLSAWLQNEQGGTETAVTRITNPPEDKEKPEASAAIPPQKGRPDAAVQVVPGSPDTGASPTPPFDRPGLSVNQQQGTVPFRRLEGALDRFCGHAGEWEPDALDRVFAPVGAGKFRQEPALFLSDGSAEMEVSFRLKGDGETVKYFLIKGARCTSARLMEPGEWLLVLTPDRGTMSATVTVLTNLETVEYPLTVTPPLSLYGPVPEDEELPCRREFVKAANERAHPQKPHLQ